MRNTELVNYNIHDNVITVNTQVRTDCHSFIFVNGGNTQFTEKERLKFMKSVKSNSGVAKEMFKNLGNA